MQRRYPKANFHLSSAVQPVCLVHASLSLSLSLPVCLFLSLLHSLQGLSAYLVPICLVWSRSPPTLALLITSSSSSASSSSSSFSSSFCTSSPPLCSPLLSSPLVPPPPPPPPPSVTSPSLIACNVPRKAQSAMTTCLSTTSFPPAVVQRQPLWNERRLVARRPHRSRQSSRLNCQAWITTLVCCLLVLVRSTDAHQLTGLTRMHARNEPADLASTTIRPSGSATATGSVQVASDISTALPRPFDSNIGNNFTTASCPAFFDRFLGHGSFIQCLPLSLLLQVS